MSFRTVTGLGSPQYGRKAQSLIEQRIAQYGSIRAYYEHEGRQKRDEQQRKNIGSAGRVSA